MMAGSVLTTLPVLLRVPRPAALLHPGADDGKRQGMTRGALASTPAWRAPRMRARVRDGACRSHASAQPPAPRRRACSIASTTSRRGRPCASDGVTASMHARRRCEAAGAAARFRSRRHRGLRDRAPRAAARSARQLRDHVLAARRRAGQRSAGQARRCERRQRLVVQPAELRVPARMAAGHDQEAADRVRVGSDEGPRAASRRDDRVRRRGRARRRPAARCTSATSRCRSCRRRRRLAAADGARVVVAARAPRRRARRRTRRDRMAQQSGVRRASSGSRSISDSRANSAVSSCTGRTASTRRATTCSSPTTAGMANACAASPTAAADARRCC